MTSETKLEACGLLAKNTVTVVLSDLYRWCTRDIGGFSPDLEQGENQLTCVIDIGNWCL